MLFPFVRLTLLYKGTVMTVPRGSLRFFCHVRRIRSSIPLRPTFEDNETWYCGTAIAVPYVRLHKDFDVTGPYIRCVRI